MSIRYWPTEAAVRTLHGRTCSNCDGAGELDLAPWPATPCPDCDGRGWVAILDPIIGAHLDTRCPACEP